MKKQYIIPFVFIFFVSCNDNIKQEPTTVAVADTIKKESPRPALAYPVKYNEWEIGDFDNVKKIVDIYKMWDDKKAIDSKDYYADTLRLRIPEVRGEYAIPNMEINKRLGENRNMYASSTNDILSAVGLHDKTSGEDWVMITTYAKWIETDGKRDSLLYHDDWRLVNGKANLLISFYKFPTKEFLKNQGKK